MEDVILIPFYGLNFKVIIWGEIYIYIYIYIYIHVARTYSFVLLLSILHCMNLYHCHELQTYKCPPFLELLRRRLRSSISFYNTQHLYIAELLRNDVQVLNDIHS